jgi:tetraacyldisaccharide 4'-kinase
MAKLVRIIFFFPIHLLLRWVLRFRHFLYDNGFLKEFAFPVPVICIGNLELGGSGKTPMADYLIARFNSHNQMAFLSRGYGRRSKGFRWLQNCSGPEEAGDEPWQLYSKWKEKLVFAVDENRVRGVQRILAEKPETNLIILDDAFQHRSIRAGLNILLTPFKRPFYQNYLFPAGSLRDIREAAGRASILVFSKADQADKKSLDKAIKSLQNAGLNGKEVYVSELVYGQVRNAEGSGLSPDSGVICLAGLARNEAFFDHCETRYKVLRKISLPDHFRYTTGFFQKENISASDTILCTEKDFAKIMSVFPFPQKVFYLPVQIRVFPEDSFIRSIEKFLSA